MSLIQKNLYLFACAVVECVLLASCGGGGGGGPGSSAPPFPTTSEDQLPAGPRIDVSTRNLFPMGAADVWNYNRLDAGGMPTGATVTRQIFSGPDASGRVSLTETETGAAAFTTDYIVSDAGLLDTAPLGVGVPPAAAAIVGAIFEYATPLYPQGSTRRHVRSGPWGADLDGDGTQESFRIELTQEFLGFETLQISGAMTLTDVAHFRNVLRLTLRPTAPGNTDATLIATEEAWFAPNLGMAKAIRSVVDSAGAIVDPLHSLGLTSATVSGANWNPSNPPPILDGQAVDIRLVHNALVYDSLRNVYYASIPGSVVGTGNSIATIDPVTRQVTHFAPIGSEPNALALAADGSVLYVGLDGSGELLRLALPAMTERGRAQLLSSDPFPGNVNAETIAVSPVDASLVAVSMTRPNVSPGHDGVALFRDLVIQPKRTQTHTGSNLVVFDSTGTTLYGFGSADARLIQVLPDGLAEQLAVAVQTSNFGNKTLSFANGRVIVADRVLDAAPAMTTAGLISNASNCVPQRSGSLLLCLSAPNPGVQGRLLIVNSSTFVIRASLLFTFNQASVERLVEGPAGQVAISYPAGFSGPTSKIRLFSSPQLVTLPTPPAPSWPVTMSSTADGQALDVGLVHNSLVYDSSRNVYYASVPGSVVGVGNTIATVNAVTGQVTHSAPIGSEPNALALAADGSVLYVGLDGSGEVLRLALPSMIEQGRARLFVDLSYGQMLAETIAVSPVDATLAAVSVLIPNPNVSPRHGGVVLLRDMVLQPQRTQGHTGSDMVVFDSAGTTLYGANGNSVRRIQVLADGLIEQLAVDAPGGLGVRRSLAFANNRVIAGPGLYDTPALTAAGVISGASDCLPERSGGQLLCLSNAIGEGRVLVANSGTFVIGASLAYATSEPYLPRRLVQGPAGQIAISYTSSSPSFATTPSIRLFTSPQLP